MASHMTGESNKIKEAKRSLRAVEKEHAKVIRDAETALRSAQKDHDDEMKELGDQLYAITQEIDGAVMSVGSATLYGDHVRIGKTSIKLSPDITATVSTSGNVYSTTSVKGGSHVSLSGAAVGGMVAGPVGMLLGGHKNEVSSTSTTHDTRRVFVEVSSMYGSGATEAGPDEETDAHEFAAKVMEYGRTYEKRKADNDERLSHLNAYVVKVASHTEGIDAAQSALDAVKADTDAVDKARTRFRSIAGISAEDEKRKEASRLERPRKIKLAVVIILLVLIAISNICAFFGELTEQNGQVALAVIAAAVAAWCIWKTITITRKYAEEKQTEFHE